MSLATASSWLKHPGATADYLTNNPQITLFGQDTPRHFPYSFLYNEIPAKENTFDFGRTVTFSIDKNTDLVGQSYLRLQISQLCDSSDMNDAFWMSFIPLTQDVMLASSCWFAVDIMFL